MKALEKSIYTHYDVRLVYIASRNYKSFLNYIRALTSVLVEL